MAQTLKMTSAEHEALANRIYAALKEGVGIDPPSESIDYTFDDAYHVRHRLVNKLIGDGGHPKGHKIGFTSVAMQQMYGMSGPDFGQLLDNMFIPYGEPIPVGHMSNTRAEPELAFELGKPLSGPGVDIAQALDNKILGLNNNGDIYSLDATTGSFSITSPMSSALGLNWINLLG